MNLVNFRKTAVGVSIEIGRVCIRLAHPCYWGLLKAVKVSKSKASSRP